MRPKKCIVQAQKVVAMNPNHSLTLAGSAVAVISVGWYELEWEFIERAKRLNPHYPSWYHFVNYLVRFQKAQYEEAWEIVQTIDTNGTYMHPLFRATVLLKLGRTDEAAVFIDKLLEIKPNFLKRPREIINLLIVLDEHVETIWNGLYKARIREFE